MALLTSASEVKGRFSTGAATLSVLVYAQEVIAKPGKRQTRSVPSLRLVPKGAVETVPISGQT